jgi:glycosyltransferase involved in cell wall biosynthesis
VNVHGVTGYLSDPGNVEEMAKYAIRILSDDSTLRDFRANAYAQARRFDINNILPDYETYYQEVVQKSVNKVE